MAKVKDASNNDTISKQQQKPKKEVRKGCIDYSKWDEIEYPSSDEDITKKNPVPRPKKEHGPTSVTVDKDGKWKVQSSVPNKPESDFTTEKKTRQQQWFQDFIKNGGIVPLLEPSSSSSSQSDNKEPVLFYGWSQDLQQVVLNIIYDPQTLLTPGTTNTNQKISINVSVQGGVQYDNRLSAGWNGPENKDGSFGSIHVTAAVDNKQTSILKGQLQNYIHHEPGSSELDWTIYNCDDYILFPNDIDNNDDNNDSSWNWKKAMIGKKMIKILLFKAVHWGDKGTRTWSNPPIHLTST